MQNLTQFLRKHANQGSVTALVTFLIGLLVTLVPAFAPQQSHLLALICGPAGLVATIASLVGIVDEVAHTAHGLGGQEALQSAFKVLGPVIEQRIKEELAKLPSTPPGPAALNDSAKTGPAVPAGVPTGAPASVIGALNQHTRPSPISIK